MALHAAAVAAAIAARWLVLGVVFGCVGFTLVSYLLAFAARPRSWGFDLLRAIVVEIGATLAVVPFWPLWLVLGGVYQAVEEGEGQARGRRNPIILLHGFAMNRTQWIWMARRLRARGHGPIYGINYFSFARIDRAARRLARFVEDVRTREGELRIDIVAHSMGGLVARYYIERLSGSKHVERLVTIGTPHRGTRIGWFGALLPGARDLLGSSALLADLGPVRAGADYTSIWSRADAVVQPPESASIVPAGSDEVFSNLGHLSLVLSPRVVDVIDNRLRA
jgi:triacylglycerol esterase/lipase EstA (alpha/beta hydrolase family)